MLKQANEDEEEQETQIMIGQYIHEILKICVKNDINVFDYIHSLINILKSDNV